MEVVERFKLKITNSAVIVKIKKNVEKINKRINRTFLLGLLSAFALMFFGGLAYFTNDKFGTEFLFLDTHWFQISIITISSTIMGLIFFWWIWSKFFRKKDVLHHETRAINLFSLGIAFASIFPLIWDITFFVLYTNETGIENLLNGTTMQYLTIYISITYVIIAFAMGLGIYWFFAKRNEKKESRKYFWIRNTLLSMFVVSFFLYFGMLCGLGSWGGDLSRIADYIGINKTSMATLWDGIGLGQKALLTPILNSIFGEGFSPWMSGNDFANELFKPGNLNLLVDHKNFFFGVNNNWHGYLVLSMTLLGAILPIIFLGKVWFKGEFTKFNGKETTFKTLNYVLLSLILMYAFDAYIITYVAPSWNPSITHGIGDLFALDYHGTPYWWTMFALVFVIPLIIINIPIIKYLNERKNQKINITTKSNTLEKT